MKKYLLSEKGNFYKANLHSHSDYSDGKLSPAELKKLYKEAGYSVLSITDHEGIFDHSYLDDEDFLTIPGYERALNDETHYEEKYGWNSVRTTHLCIYPKDRKNLRCVADDPEYIYPKMRWMTIPEIRKSMKYIGEPFYFTPSVANVNHVIKEANENGFLVVLNHPDWSQQPFEEYSQYEGLFAMEVHNTGCTGLGCNDSTSVIYDMMLKRGHKLFCVATDDNHNEYPIDHPKSDSLGGWVMVKADALTHESIMEALINGNFYSSTGPQIKELYIEDGAVHIETSPACDIRIMTGNRFAEMEASYKDTLTSATFKLPAVCGFFRLEVTDTHGKKAYTNAYFPSELSILNP